MTTTRFTWGRRWTRMLLGISLIATVVPLWSQPASAATGPTLTVDAAADNHHIDPRIYGINGYLLDPVLAAEIDLPIERSGGDGASEYNPVLSTTSQAANWYYQIFKDTSAPDQIPRNNLEGRDTMLTLPAMGWVANAPGHAANPAINACAYPLTVYPGQTMHDSENDPSNDNNCGSGWVCPAGTTAVNKDADGNPLDPSNNANSFGFGESRCELPNHTLVAPNRIEGNDPTLGDACPGGRPNPGPEPYRCNAPAAMDAAWVQSLVNQYGTAANGGVEFWSLDNEPDLWQDTHHHVHPQCVSYDEIFTHNRDAAAALKSVDPTAKTLGPVASDIVGSIDVRYDNPNENPGTCSIHSDPSPDRAAKGDFVPWYLAQMHQYEIDHGVRLLDVLDQHFYPQADGVVFQPAGDAATQARRLRSTRSLWDPSFVDEGWQPDVYPDLRIEQIPRMKRWIAQNYPGTKTAITEYNFGGLDDVNGALAQADVLGIFAREGLDIATFWPDNGGFTSDMPGANGFKIFRNYDGNGSKFGDTWVKSTSGNAANGSQGDLAVYSAKRADGALTTLVINKTTQPLTSTLNVNNYNPAAQAEVWRYSGANNTAILHQPNVSVTPAGAMSTTYPANSMTLLVMPQRTTTPTTLTAQGIVLHVGNPFPINPNVFTPKATLLKANGQPIPGQPIVFTAGASTLCTGTTDAAGLATCTNTAGGALAVITALGYQATYAGNATYDPALAKGPLIKVGGLAL